MISKLTVQWETWWETVINTQGHGQETQLEVRCGLDIFSAFPSGVQSKWKNFDVQSNDCFSLFIYVCCKLQCCLKVANQSKKFDCFTWWSVIYLRLFSLNKCSPTHSLLWFPILLALSQRVQTVKRSMPGIRWDLMPLYWPSDKAITASLLDHYRAQVKPDC